MPTLLADNDVGGQLQALLHICNSDDWRDLWLSLGCDVQSFEGLGLRRDMPDRDVWLACQSHQVVLITGNRNEEDATSLEATIRELGTIHSLPVVTIGDPVQVLTDREYALRAAVRLMEYLIDIESLRGAGRLYLP